VTVALIAMSEVTRPLRWANVAVGLGLLATPRRLARDPGPPGMTPRDRGRPGEADA
jgi:hypothetical protein